MPKDEDVRVRVEWVLKREDLQTLAEMIGEAIARHARPAESRAPPSSNKLLTVKEASRRLGVSERTLRRYLTLGLVRAVQGGGARPRVTEAEVAAICDKGLRPWPEDGLQKRR